MSDWNAPPVGPCCKAAFKERSNGTGRAHIEELVRAEAEGTVYSAMVLGDSMFERYMTTGPHVWPIVEAHGRVFNAGVGGDKVSNLLYRLENLNFCDHLPPTLRAVVLMIGSNDIERGKPHDIAQGVHAVLTHLHEHKNTKHARVAVLAIPPRLPSERKLKPEKVEASRLEYNALLASLCASRGVPFADMSERFAFKPKPTPAGVDAAAPPHTADRALDSDVASGGAPSAVPVESTSAGEAWRLVDGVLDHALYDDFVHFNAKGYEVYAPFLGEVIRGLLAGERVEGGS